MYAGRVTHRTLLRAVLPWALGLGLVLTVLGMLTASPVQGTAPTDRDVIGPAGPSSDITITVPLAKVSVKLDGNCDSASEYSDAVAFTFNDYLSFQGSIYLKQDATNLYVCMVGSSGPLADRFAAVYLDTNNGQESIAQANDAQLMVRITDSVTSTGEGTGAGGYAPATIGGWQASGGGNADLDIAEYAIPLSLTGGLCNAPFGIAVYHHWLTTTGDDYGWPSAMWYDQPQTWQTAMLSNSPCPSTQIPQNVPQSIYRRAAQHLEDMRGSPLAPGWEQAQLGPVVHELFRPDISSPAYYEFLVLAPTGLGIQSSEATTQAGFIILSAGEHDFPIAHWNYFGESPTQELTRKALESGGRAFRFFKLDALAYAAEDVLGHQVATSGTPLLKVTGMQASWLKQPMTVTSSIWTPNQSAPDDGVGTGISGTLTTTGPISSPLQLSGWESWGALKQGYEASYGVLAESLRRQASQDWQVESLVYTFGVVLRKGEVYTMPLLEAEAGVSTVGEGLEHVMAETVKRPGLLPALRFTALDSTPGAGYPLTVTIAYASMPTETVRILIYEPYSVFLPAVLNGSSAVATMGAMAAQDSWGPWSLFWAGNGNDQRLYDQIPAHTGPNPTGCPSGCGPTAWAMLFGWADHQAALGNPAWAGRNGIYRANGGYGADADAPVTMDAGVRNMTWEIHNRVGTWCAFGSGPTLPWDMSGAANYLAGRSYTQLYTHYNIFGIHEDRLRDYAINSIVYRHTPAVIGIGWLTHYPLAYGYASQSRTVSCGFFEFWCSTRTEYNRWFYVNEGWGGAGNGWVATGTWFAGEIAR
jgi:hypothetical protein